MGQPPAVAVSHNAASTWSPRRLGRTLRAAATLLCKSPRGLLTDLERFLGRRALAPRGDDTQLQFAPLVHPQCVPLHLRVDGRLPATLNILIPAIQPALLSGGPNTALHLGHRLAEAGVNVRFVSTDRPCASDQQLLWDHLSVLTKLPAPHPRIAFVSAHDRGRALTVGPRDVFLATSWWTAYFAHHAARAIGTPEFIYLIQDYEPGMSAWSSTWALAEATYALPHRAIVCSQLLFDFLTANRVGRFADPQFSRDACVFEPAVDRAQFFPRSDDLAAPLSPPARRRLLFYARPSAPRNLYELGLIALRRAVEQQVFSADGWEFFAMGEALPPVDLGRGVVLRPLPWAGYADYARQLRTADVGLSLMLSPHTSYPPLEMAACGATVVTNTFSVKTAERLAQLSGNLLAVAPEIDQLTSALNIAALRSASHAERRAGATIHAPVTWDESFAHAVPTVREWINERASGVSLTQPRAA